MESLSKKPTLAKQKISALAKQWIQKEAKRLGTSEADIVRRLLDSAASKE